ncbi:D-alanyl-D-alanine carboxypeptidase [Kitasatospora sp. DSM 101779]|uniref:D-alanyl-D-alanine carboxypeptidase n=1 Tax=Kitasatospora sp. DSM 101779 TaxID=2853165 RepID=UPI0021D89CE3|nr:D-alanyl-D-alanine carboxypeptidase [Kitasatospora sp. DSM 101779]MCU7820861.1 D-alanyl-D-alanine carboxypeptidase [Kitasatospora sp. DSM 101779]
MADRPAATDTAAGADDTADDTADGTACPAAAGETVRLRIEAVDGPDAGAGAGAHVSADEPAGGKPTTAPGANARLPVDAAATPAPETAAEPTDGTDADGPAGPRTTAAAGATVRTRVDPGTDGTSRPTAEARAEPDVDVPAAGSLVAASRRPGEAPGAPAAAAPPPVAPQITAPAPAAAPAPDGEPPVDPKGPRRRTAGTAALVSAGVALLLGGGAVLQLVRPLPAPKAMLTLAESVRFPGGEMAVDWPVQGQSAAAVVGVGSLGTSGEQTPVPIASVTKVMNADLVLKAHPLKPGESGPMITVDRAGTQYAGDESHVQLVEGQKISQRQALEMLMLPSANNVARLLARWDAGSEEAFIAKMNAEAARLGMADTTYADPAGYDNDTRSTAADQLKLAEEVMKDETFREIVAEPSTRFNGELVTNTNHLVASEAGTVIGVKTGSSSAAQSALMWAAVKDVAGTRRTIIGVTLRQPFVKNLKDALAAQPPSLKAIQSIRRGLTEQTVVSKGQVVGRVDDGLGTTVPVVADRDVTVAGWSGLTATIALESSGIPRSGGAGTRVGTLAVVTGATRVEVPVSLQHGLTAPSLATRLLRRP